MELPITAHHLDEGSFMNSIMLSEQGKLKELALIKESRETVIRAVIYLRVSTPKQAGKDKASLKEQEIQVSEVIKNNGWILSAVYKDAGKSGTKVVGRDEYIKMIEDAKNKRFDVIVFWDFDRFGRGGAGQVLSVRDELMGYGVQITSVTCPIEIDNPCDMTSETSFPKDVLIAIQAIVGKEENRKRALRMSLAKNDKAKRGFIPCKIPYGYRKIVKDLDGGTKTEKIVINKKEALVVQEIFNLYDQTGTGIMRIAEHLNLKGTSAPRGGQWEYTSVRYILNNFTYTGLVRWGWYLSRSKKKRLLLTNPGKGIVQKGHHPAIIPEEQFQRVQSKKQRRSQMGGKAVGTTTGLLVGLAKCGRCGGGTYVTKWPHWYAYRQPKDTREKFTPTRAYLCSNYSRKGKSGCQARYVMSQDKLESKVISQIRELANNEATQKSFIARMKTGNKQKIKNEITFLKESLKELESKLDRQKRSYEAGIKSLAEYQQDARSYETNKTETVEAIFLKEQEFSQESVIIERSLKSIKALLNFDILWEKADFVQKKELLRSIIEKVEVRGNAIELFFIS